MQASAPSQRAAAQPIPRREHDEHAHEADQRGRSSFSAVGGSSGSSPSENSSVISGVSALKIPASSDETSVSP